MSLFLHPTVPPIRLRPDHGHRVQVQDHRHEHPVSLQEDQTGDPGQDGRRHAQVLLQRGRVPDAGVMDFFLKKGREITKI